jgi:HEPN domain-containing protein
MLEFLKNEGAYADVVREAQEVVELMLKGLTLYYGLDVPKVHDVSRFIEENINVFP